MSRSCPHVLYVRTPSDRPAIDERACNSMIRPTRRSFTWTILLALYACLLAAALPSTSASANFWCALFEKQGANAVHSSVEAAPVGFVHGAAHFSQSAPGSGKAETGICGLSAHTCGARKPRVCAGIPRARREASDENEGQGMQSDIASLYGPDCPCSESPPAWVPDAATSVWSALKLHVLKTVMQHAVNRQRFEDAVRLKGEVDELSALHMVVVEDKIRDRVSRMRQRLQKSDLLRLRHELDMALAEEDYARAVGTDASLRHKCISTPAFDGAKHLDWIWLATDVDVSLRKRRMQLKWLELNVRRRVRTLRSRTMLQLEDRAFRLQSDLHLLVQEEDYRRAAHVHAALREELGRRERERMWSDLKQRVDAQRQHEELLARHPLEELEYQLQDAVAREEYDDACELRGRLSALRQDSLLETLQDEIAAARADSSHSRGLEGVGQEVQARRVDGWTQGTQSPSMPGVQDEGARLQKQPAAADDGPRLPLKAGGGEDVTEESVGLQEQLDAAVGKQDFKTAASLRRRQLALEHRQMMAMLEEKLVQSGAQRFSEPASSPLSQFAYLGNLGTF